MKIDEFVIERCSETGLFVGHVPGIRRAHSQAETVDELQANIREVLEMLREEITGNRPDV
jgi:predicted RNase H-like HicB family nuclease